MADLGNLQFSVSLKDMTDADIKKIKDKLEKAGFKINASADRKSLEKNINDILRNRTFKINVEPNKKIKKAAIEVNKSLLVNSVTSALKGKTFKANVDVVVKTASVQDAIKQAFAKAGMNYNTTASDVRAQRILEIQQRMALRAAQANNNLNRSYREASIGASQFARATVGLNNGLQSNIRFGGKLGTVLGNLASILSSTNILKDVIRIGGELENQRIALGAILQDGGKATDMFSKIQSLAVKSPFGIMDLNQYVKQLAAYSVPYNELYETMKRLADVSAGVGVDMGRIILAFGQVKAAGFLKGTELRQFTEANIPMVDKLAERFTNLTGKIVGAAEVYDMISKKKVTFEDVKAVLWDLTDEGGMFNNMQEVLSESLASKWKNLADVIDVMYGKISDGWVGDALKGVAGLLTEITKGWEYVGTAITSASVAFLTHKAAVLLGSKQIASTKNLYSSFLSDKRVEANNLRVAKTYRALTSAEQELIRTTNQLTVADVKRLARAKLLNREEALRIISIKKLDAATLAYIQRLYGISDAQVRAARSSTWMGRAMAQLGNGVRSLGAALKGLFLNPWTWAFGIITAIGELFTYWKKKQEEIEQRNNDIAESANGSAESLERELMKIKDMDISKMNTDQIKIKIEELTTVIKNEAFGWQGILDDVFAKEADGTFTNSAAEQLDMLKTKINEIAEAKKALADNNEVYSNVIGDTESGSFFGLGGSDIIDAMKALNKAVDENDKKLRGLGKHLTDVASAVNFATSDNAGISELLKGKNPIKQVEILQTYENEWAKFKAKLNEINAEASKTVELWDSSINSITSYAVGGYLNTLLWKFGKAKEAMREELTLSGEDINNLSEKGAQIVKGFVETSIKESSTQKTKMKQFYYDLWTEAFDIDWVDLGYIVPPNSFDDSSKEDYDPSKDEVAKLWKKRAEEIDKAVAAYDKWKKVEGAGNAEQRIKGMDEFENLFNGKYGFSLSLENPTRAYEYIQSKLNKNLSAQKELIVNLGVKISDAELKDAQEKVKLLLEDTKNQIKEASDKWNLYKQLFELTGDKEFALTAFNVTPVWDEAAKEMKAKLEDSMKTLGLDFDADFDIDDSDAKIIFGDLYDAWKEIKDRIEKNGIDLKVNAANAIKSTQSVSDKIRAEENKRDAELKKYASQYGINSDEYKAKQKEFNDNINKLKSELIEVSPEFKALFVDTVGMASTEIQALYEKAKKLVNLIRQNTTRIDKDSEGNIIGRAYTKGDGSEGYILEETFKSLEKQSNSLGKTTEKTTTVFERLWGSIRGKNKLGEGQEKGTFDGIVKDISAVAQEASNAAQSISSMFDALGDEGTADAFALGGNILSGVSSIGQGLASDNPFAVLSGVTGIIGSIAQHHDKKLDRAIKKSQLEVQKLTNAYKQLETTIERQLGSVTSTQSKEMLENLKSQKSELQKQYDLEDEKKKTDKSKLEDYKNQIAELDDQIKYFYEDLASEQYGVDIKGWSSQIAEALTEAFATGEDAAKAFDDTVADILRKLATEAIKLQFIEPAMKNLREYMFGDNGIFTDNSSMGTDLSSSELSGLKSELDKLKGQIDASNDYWDKINDAVGGILDSTGNAKGGLSKEIEGVTEDTANLLGSYLNSIRHEVSVKRSIIEKLAGEDIPKMSLIAQAQLTQLNNIASNTLRNAEAADRIYDLFNRVVDKGGNKLKI